MPLAPLQGRRFAALVADRLGTEPALAEELLFAMRIALGRPSFLARCGAFAVGSSRSVQRALPEALRRRALLAFVGPLLRSPAALNAFAAGRGGFAGRQCAGLLTDD